MSRLASWMVTHGFGQYVEAFQSSDITYDLLCELNQEDLKELGLTLGHQKKFLRSARALPNPGDVTQTVPATAGGIQASHARTDIIRDSVKDTLSERRQLTVMFCDLVDSTLLVNKIGAEEMRDLYRDYQDLCAQAVERYNGYIATYLGDGVMVYFGYPQAHERDPERCLRAALLLLQLVRDLNRRYRQKLDIEVAVRIGIATGPVVVGDIIGEHASLQISVVGATPNLAARAQAAGKENAVTVSDLTYKLAKGAFVFKDLGEHFLKGMGGPVQLWEATGQSRPTRLMNRASRSGNQMVGRSAELGCLHQCWQSAREGKGQLVSVHGEAGIGKSRLLETFIIQSECTDWYRLHLQCSPYYTGSVLYPVLALFERFLEQSGGDKHQLLRSFFAESARWRDEAVRYFGKLLFTAEEIPDHDEQLSAQVLQQRAFDAMIDTVEQRSNSKPMIVLIEDAHWLDSTSIDLFNRLLLRLHVTPCMLIVSARPEFTPPWQGYQCAITDIPVNKLDPQRGREIIQSVEQGAELPPDLVNLILEKTDGVPLFIEELTKSLIEQQNLQQTRQQITGKVDFSATDTSAIALGIPETLNDLLMSRLDQEPSVKRVAQIGSAIGREFAYRLLASIAPHNDEELQSLLYKVVDSEVVFESGQEPGSAFTFRHALLQDAAYQSLLLKNRKQLHATIAQTMESTPAYNASAELIAHHWTEASQPAEAVNYWHQAARQASGIWANAEAVKRYRHALKACEQLKADKNTNTLKLDLLLELGAALRAVSGSSAAETIAVFDEATRLCNVLENTDYSVRAYYGAFATNFTAAKLDLAQQAALTLLEISIKHNHDAGMAAGHQALGMHAFAKGDLENARTNLEKSLTYQSSWHFEHDIQYPALSQSYLSWTLYLLGDEQQAQTLMNVAIEEAQSTSAYNHALVMANACYLHQFRGDTATLASLTATLKALSSEKGMPVWYAVAEFFDCWQHCQQTPDDEHLDTLVEALEFWAEDEIETPYFKAIVADTLTRNGRVKEGKILASQAVKLAQETGEVWYELHG